MSIGHLHQKEYAWNQHQAHRSQRYPKDLWDKRCMLTNQRLIILFQEENVVAKYGIFFAILMLFQPLLMFKPENAIYICLQLRIFEIYCYILSLTKIYIVATLVVSPFT